MMTRMLALCACVGLLLSLAGGAFAGPNEGGTLILHANPTLTFTSDIANYCGMAGLDSCSHAVTSVAWDPGKKIVFHAIAAFPPGSSPRLKGLSFGISYDPAKFILAARGSCADFELPDGTWPASGTGTAQSWTTATQTGLLTEAYWFCGYAYAEDEQAPDSTTVELIPHPVQHGVFVSDAFPAETDTIVGYGRLGLGTAGELPYQSSGLDGVEGLNTEDPLPDVPGDQMATDPCEEREEPHGYPYYVRVLDLETGEPIQGARVKAVAQYTRHIFCDPTPCSGLPQYTYPQHIAFMNTDSNGEASYCFPGAVADCLPLDENCYYHENYSGMSSIDIPGTDSDIEPCIMISWRNGNQGEYPISHVIYALRESQIAERFRPVIHTHHDENVSGTDDPGTVARACALMRVNIPGGVNWYLDPITSFHYNGSNPRWCTNGETCDGIEHVWIDFDNSELRSGAPVGQRPLYYHIFPLDATHVVVQYWLWFNYNNLGNYTSPGHGNHEGDWEYVAIKLEITPQGALEPVAVNMARHDCLGTFDPSECWWSQSAASSYYGLVQGYRQDFHHLHVWMASRSHALYNRFEDVYSIDCVLETFFDRLDYNIANQPEGDHGYLTCDLLTNMGEYTTCEGSCAGHSGCWQRLVQGGPLDWMRFSGKFGQPIGCSSICTEGPEGPVLKGLPGEWTTFTEYEPPWCASPGWPCNAAFDSARYLDGNYLGRFETCASSDIAQHIRFGIDGHGFSCNARAHVTIDPGSTVVFHDAESGEIELGPPDANGIYTFDQWRISGQGTGRIDLVWPICSYGAPLAKDLYFEIGNGCNGISEVLERESSGRLEVAPTPTARGAWIQGLPPTGSWKIMIVDVGGRVVRSIGSDETRAAGVGRVYWDSTDDRGEPVASGVYLVHYRGASAPEETERVVVLR